MRVELSCHTHPVLSPPRSRRSRALLVKAEVLLAMDQKDNASLFLEEVLVAEDPWTPLDVIARARVLSAGGPPDAASNTGTGLTLSMATPSPQEQLIKPIWREQEEKPAAAAAAAEPAASAPAKGKKERQPSPAATDKASGKTEADKRGKDSAKAPAPAAEPKPKSPFLDPEARSRPASSSSSAAATSAAPAATSPSGKGGTAAKTSSHEPPLEEISTRGARAGAAAAGNGPASAAAATSAPPVYDATLQLQCELIVNTAIQLVNEGRLRDAERKVAEVLEHERRLPPQASTGPGDRPCIPQPLDSHRWAPPVFGRGAGEERKGGSVSQGRICLCLHRPNSRRSCGRSCSLQTLMSAYVLRGTVRALSQKEVELANAELDFSKAIEYFPLYIDTYKRRSQVTFSNPPPSFLVATIRP